MIEAWKEYPRKAQSRMGRRSPLVKCNINTWALELFRKTLVVGSLVLLSFMLYTTSQLFWNEGRHILQFCAFSAKDTAFNRWLTCMHTFVYKHCVLAADFVHIANIAVLDSMTVQCCVSISGCGLNVLKLERRWKIFKIWFPAVQRLLYQYLRLADLTTTFQPAVNKPTCCQSFLCKTHAFGFQMCQDRLLLDCIKPLKMQRVTDRAVQFIAK